MAPHEAAEASGRDLKGTRSKTHAPSESTRHGEDTLAVNPRDDASEPRRSRVFLARSCHKGVERPVCRAKAWPLPLGAVRHPFVLTFGDTSGKDSRVIAPTETPEPT
jgi:hypothetical protein